MSTFDCRACGACCTLEVDVTFPDEVPEALVKEDRLYGPVMRRRKGRCIALKGKLGCSVSCSIYADRPQVCRDFKPGSRLCLEVRRELGLEDPVGAPTYPVSP